MVPSATPARSAISETREWKKPCSAITSMAASRMRWCLSEVSFAVLAVGSGRFTIKELNLLGFAGERNEKQQLVIFNKIWILWQSWHFRQFQCPFCLPANGRVPFQEFAKSLSAMTVLPFLFQRQLGKSLAQPAEIEKRVITKASGAPGAGQQLSWSFPEKRGQRFTFSGNSDHTHIFSRNLSRRQAF